MIGNGRLYKQIHISDYIDGQHQICGPVEIIGGPTFKGVDGRIPAIHHGAGDSEHELNPNHHQGETHSARTSPNVGTKKWRGRVRGQAPWRQRRKSEKGQEELYFRS